MVKDNQEYCFPGDCFNCYYKGICNNQVEQSIRDSHKKVFNKMKEEDHENKLKR